MIENVLICGIGAVGTIYADKIQKFSPNNLKILVDEQRLAKYSQNPVIFNGKELIFDYILPKNTDFKADLIIIATKFDALPEVINNIKNFVSENTLILSLLNGVTSEAMIAEKYGWDKLLLSYFIGHSAVREGRNVTQDGVGTIVFGAKPGAVAKNVRRLAGYFDRAGINYEIPEDMERSLWLKFMLNVSTNQPSAILRMTFGEMQANERFMMFAAKLMNEVRLIAREEGVQNSETMIDEALSAFLKISPDGKTSMYQDVLANRKTEVEMFAGTVIQLAKKHGIPVPYNEFMYEMFGIIHENYSSSSSSSS